MPRKIPECHGRQTQCSASIMLGAVICRVCGHLTQLLTALHVSVIIFLTPALRLVLTVLFVTPSMIMFLRALSPRLSQAVNLYPLDLHHLRLSLLSHLVCTAAASCYPVCLRLTSTVKKHILLGSRRSNSFLSCRHHRYRSCTCINTCLTCVRTHSFSPLTFLPSRDTSTSLVLSLRFRRPTMKMSSLVSVVYTCTQTEVFPEGPGLVEIGVLTRMLLLLSLLLGSYTMAPSSGLDILLPSLLVPFL